MNVLVSWKKGMLSAALPGMILIGMLWAGTLALAQGGEDTCPALVDIALAEVGAACADLGRDEACYGHFRVDAEFFQARDDLAFSVPADSVPLADLRTIRTAPLDVTAEQWGVAVLNLQANLPETLPGQAVRFLLMGDVTLENAVEPGDEPVSISAETRSAANLRSRPTTNANVIGSVPAGTALLLGATNAARDWYEVQLETGGTAWVWAELVQADAQALASLPVSGGPRYGPMQAFYFAGGLGEPACQEAPNALVIQSPAGVSVALNVNGLDIAIGSSVILSTAEAEGEAVLLITLLQGRVAATVNGVSLVLEQPRAAGAAAFPAVAVTLNSAGLVDQTSRVVAAPEESVALAVAGACQAGVALGVVGVQSADCAAPIQTPTPTPVITPTSVPATQEPASEAPAASGGIPAYYHFEIWHCRMWTGNKEQPWDGPIQAGGQVHFLYGTHGFASPEARSAAIGGQSISIQVDGVPLAGMWLEDLYTGVDWVEMVKANWIATPGTHTVQSGWSNPELNPGGTACTFTVE